MIRNIIWDVDGTLFDTYPAIIAAFQAVLIANGCSTAPGHIADLAQISLTHCVQVLAAEFSLDPDRTGAQFSNQYARSSLASQPPFPGVAQVCQAVSDLGGLNLIVTHRSLRSLRIMLEYNHLDHFITTSLSAQDGFPTKPDPAMFNELVHRFELVPTETLTVGDRDIDIQAGAAAGLCTCGFGSQIRQSRPDFLLTDYQDLLAILKNPLNH
jgi:phosphoglycolate phosphatase-like HAD superfamily hydrolase